MHVDLGRLRTLAMWVLLDSDDMEALGPVAAGLREQLATELSGSRLAFQLRTLLNQMDNRIENRADNLADFGHALSALADEYERADHESASRLQRNTDMLENR
ncbi:hypothetical protein [Nocardia iowensis]|uniref:GGDEF domain-containing protein n=1 Tax=Nocardia iowensis TaxID=204891 RepID=A0ABX8RZB7_NOCIO|nr:hypothetical protein [Nocardia iowensis]QXN94616.1 hypothetical protein KV110_17115 [Nocardia iowensis]